MNDENKSRTVSHPPVVHSAITKLMRAEISGVNAHTLPVALARADSDNVPFATMNERQVAIALLDRAGFPETVDELKLFLNLGHTLTPASMRAEDITADHAPRYVTWLAGFLNDPEPNVQKNARILLRWLVTAHQETIAANQKCLDAMRRAADDSEASWRNAAYVAYALGLCGAHEDYDRVVKQAELVIEHDREHADMVAEALYKLYPPALINALEYFLDQSQDNAKQFIAGIALLAKVADIDDPAFWSTYYDDMDRIVKKVNELAGRNRDVERIVDLIEKHLAYVGGEDEA